MLSALKNINLILQHTDVVTGNTWIDLKEKKFQDNALFLMWLLA